MSVSAEMRQKIAEVRVFAGVNLEDVSEVVPLAESLLSGGIKGIELTLRTDAAFDALEAMCTQFPELLIGAGTVLREDQVERVKQLGVHFAVAPGCNPRVICKAQEVGLPFAPGICTPSDIERALEAECRVLKFFPCGPLGGLSFLESMSTPFAHLGVGYIPFGGVHAGNLAEYLSSPIVEAIGGSWIASPQAIDSKDWAGIQRRAKEAAAILENL